MAFQLKQISERVLAFIGMTDHRPRSGTIGSVKASGSQVGTLKAPKTSERRVPLSGTTGQEKDHKDHAEPQGGGSNWLREVVEAISIALILAFLFRAFEAEAFVIPTGSMAPTLMGRHKDLACERCGFAFQTGASEEVDKINNRATGRHVLSATCPNCRYTMYVGPNKSDGPATPSYKGDRILVSKYQYHLWSPRRWDVVVFKYPGDASTNFIKRLVGLPNETVRIFHGDVYIQPLGANSFQIARKSPRKLLAVLQPVYDDDRPPRKLLEVGWPERWQPEPGQEDLWQIDREGRAYTTVTAPADKEAFLRYRHFVPAWEDWLAAEQGLQFDTDQIRPQLISDFVAYNTNQSEADQPFLAEPGQSQIPPRGDQLGLHWVSDLAVECEADVQSPSGEIVMELTAGGRRFQARIDIATKTVKFLRFGPSGFVKEAACGVGSPGRYKLRFANVDHQLVLWVNNHPIVVEYEADWHGPTLDDRDRPVAVGSRGATVTFRHLKLSRDVYYIAHDRRFGLLMHDFDWEQSPYRFLVHGPFASDHFRKKVAEVMADPSQWDFFETGRRVDFSLGPDQFFVLGDNSPQSEDGRFWMREYYVRRELLVGKALAVIWPHSLDRIPGTRIPIRFFPNFGRMKIVR